MENVPNNYNFRCIPYYSHYHMTNLLMKFVSLSNFRYVPDRIYVYLCGCQLINGQTGNICKA